VFGTSAVGFRLRKILAVHPENLLSRMGWMDSSIGSPSGVSFTVVIRRYHYGGSAKGIQYGGGCSGEGVGRDLLLVGRAGNESPGVPPFLSLLGRDTQNLLTYFTFCSK